MIDTTTLDGRLVAAALRLAAERPWSEVTLLDIATAAGVGLAEVRGTVASKSDVLARFSRMIDDTVLAGAKARPAGQSVRDTVFEIVMARFDALGPHRKALASIHAGAGLDPALVRSAVASQHWMLQAAGVDTAGVTGAARLAGLASVYAAVYRVWLEDDDPGLARTMAALDRRLRSGERTLSFLEEGSARLKRLVASLVPGMGGARPATQPSSPPPPGAGGTP